MTTKRKARSSGTATRAAVTVGTALGRIAARVDRWLAQRDDIAQELTAVIGRAQSMLSRLNKETADVRKQAVKTVRAAQRAAKRTRRNLSATARKKRAAKAKDAG